MDDESAIEQLETAFQQIQEVADWVNSDREYHTTTCSDCEGEGDCSICDRTGYEGVCKQCEDDTVEECISETCEDGYEPCVYCDEGDCRDCEGTGRVVDEEGAEKEFYSKFMQIMRRLNINYFLNEKEIKDYNDKAR